MIKFTQCNCFIIVTNDDIFIVDNTTYNAYCDKAYCSLNEFKKNEFNINTIKSEYIELTNKVKIIVLWKRTYKALPERHYPINDYEILVNDFLIQYIKSKDEIIRNKYRY